MTTQPIQAASANPSSSSTAGTPTVDKNMFIKLLVAQMHNQDPMQPKDDSQWMAQMAQFSQLEQINNLATTSDRIATSLEGSRSLSLIGRTVSYIDQAGVSQQGVVDKVDIAHGKATLDVAGHGGIDASAVTEVR